MSVAKSKSARHVSVQAALCTRPGGPPEGCQLGVCRRERGAPTLWCSAALEYFVLLHTSFGFPTAHMKMPAIISLAFFGILRAERIPCTSIAKLSSLSGVER
eukprot:6448474-Pyramimonas_sp.AAC.1